MADPLSGDDVPQLLHTGLRIALLGVPELTWGGVPLAIPRRQTRALLYRLAAQSMPVPRDRLCYLFWPDVGDTIARRNLTHLLTHLRGVLPQPELLQTDDGTVALDGRAMWCDTVIFDRLTVTAAADRPAALREAVALYRGPFLAGFGLPNCPEYETWVDGERSVRERRYLDTLAAVIEQATAQREYATALAFVQRYLEVEELAEEMHRRLIALYAALGDRAAAMRQFERCTVVLEREVGVSPLAETRSIYEDVRDGRPVLPLRSAAAAVTPNTPDVQLPGGIARAAAGLPAAMGPLIGRTVELDELCTLLRDPEIRLLTLSGPGGAGKTRLALDVARAVVPEYAQGATLVELAPLRDPALVVPGIAAALGLSDQSERPPLARLQERLRDRQLLLLLDNFEHVLAAAPDVAALLAAAPRLKVMVTSRAVLRLSGEHIYAVPALSVPDVAPLPPLDDLARIGAVTLFVTRVRARLTDFRLTAANAPEIAAICLRLEGLPLALELAAARAVLLSPRALLARLDHQLALLTGGPRDLPERQRTLRATIDWSYELLDVGERLLLGRVAVFAGGWTLEAAEAISATVGEITTDVLTGLQALVDKQLVKRSTGTDGELRFSMLETIREYAMERLTERGELAATQQAHACWFLDLAERAAPALHGPEQAAWFDRLEEEHPNLRVALGSLLDTGAMVNALRLGHALRHFWLMRGHLTEGRHWLDRALKVAAPDLLVEPHVLGRARTAAAVLAFSQGDLDATGEHCALAVPLWRRLVKPGAAGDEARRFLVQTLGIWSAPLHLRRDGRLAAVGAELFGLMPEIDDPHFRAFAGIRHGQRLLETGDLAAAQQVLLAGLATFRELGDVSSVAESLIGLGSVALWEGDVVTALSLLEEAFAQATTIHDRALEAWALNNLGEAARLGGDDAAANEHYLASLQRYRDIDNRVDMPRLLHNLGYVALHTGEPQQARARFRESLTHFRSIDARRGMAEAVAGLAAVATIAGTEVGALTAAELWGAADAICLAEGISVWPADSAERQRYETVARLAVATDLFDRAYTRGSELTIEEAITAALAV